MNNWTAQKIVDELYARWAELEGEENLILIRRTVFAGQKNPAKPIGVWQA